MLMNRRRLFFIVAGLCLSLLLAPYLYAQDSGEVTIQTEKIAENIYVFQDSGGMGNVAALTGADGVLMIDTKIEASVDLLLAEIAAVCPEPVRFAVITHWHYDHVGGNETVSKAGATVIAHENVRNQMGVDHNMELLGAEVPASPDTAKPMMTS
jgi:glyoxylase-like metal-dependent hydrolase (beta-lactamase superfamily II)